VLDRATALDPKNGETALAWGKAWSLADRQDKAIEALTEALRVAPDDLRIYVELGQRMLDAGRVAEARKVLQQGLDRPFNRDSYRGLLDRPRRHRLWCMVGQSHLQERRPGSPRAADQVAKAREALRQAELELGPDHWRGRALLGGIYHAQGQLLAAVGCYQEADKMLDWQGRTAEKLAVQLALLEMQAALGQYGPAQETLRAILRVRRNQPVALAMRAAIDLRVGRPRTAVPDAARALKGLQRRTTTASKPSQVGRTGRDDLVRQTLRVRWAACRLANQRAKAEQAERDLSPLTVADRLFWANISYQYGLARESTKLLDQAEQAYLAVVQADPTHVEAVRRLAGLYARKNQRSKALDVVQAALKALAARRAGPDAAAVATARARLEALRIELAPKLPADQRGRQIVASLSAVKDPIRRSELLADHWLAAGQAHQAVKVLNAAAESRPEDVRLLERQFAAALAAKDFSTARAVIPRATKLNADGAGGRLYEGRVLLARGLDAQAEARKRRTTDPDRAGDAEKEATGLLSQALDALRAGAEEAPGQSMARVWLGRALAALDRDEARDAYQMALEINPINPEAHRALARPGRTKAETDLDVTEHLGQAIALWPKGVDGMPTDAWLRTRAEEMYEQNHPNQSIRRREAVRKAKPTDVENLLRLGLLYGRVGQQAKADQCLRQATKAAPNDIQLHQRVCELYRLDKRYEDGTKALEGLASRLKGPERAEALLLLGRHLQQVMTERQSDQTPEGELRELRDRADWAFEEAAKARPTPTVCLAAAEFCLQTQRRAEAVKWLRQALRVEQNGVDERPIREKLIRTLLAIRPLPAEVEREIAHFDARFQGDRSVSLFWGMLQAARGELDQAVVQHTRYLERLIGATTSSHSRPGQLAEAYYLRGNLYLHLAAIRPARSDEYVRLALADLRQAEAHAPRALRHARHAIALALAQERAGRPDAARRQLKAVVRDYEGDPEAVRELVDMLGRQKKWADQETVIRRQMRREPKSWQWPHLLGIAAERRRARAEAERAFKRAAELCDYGAQGVGRQAVVRLLRVMAQRGGYHDMIGLVEKQTTPSQRGYKVWIYYGVALARTNRTEAAISAWEGACKTVITTQEQAAISHVMLELLGRDKALQAVRRMIQSAGGPCPRILLAVMLDQTGQRDQAIEVTKQAISADPQPAERTCLLAYLGTLHLLKGGSKQAAELFRQSLEIDDENTVALNNLAYVLSEQLDKPKQALVYAQRAAELTPDDIKVLDTLGWCLTLTGDHQAAVAVLEEAYSKHPIAPICYHLAETYRRIGQIDGARQTAQKGIELAKQRGDKAYQTKLEKLLTQIKPGK